MSPGYILIEPWVRAPFHCAMAPSVDTDTPLAAGHDTASLCKGIKIAKNLRLASSARMLKAFARNPRSILDVVYRHEKKGKA